MVLCLSIITEGLNSGIDMVRKQVIFIRLTDQEGLRGVQENTI